jgi:hypothetical protein
MGGEEEMDEAAAAAVSAAAGVFHAREQDAGRRSMPADKSRAADLRL